MAGQRPNTDSTTIDLTNLSAENFLHLAVGNSGFQTWHSWFTLAGLQIPEFGQPTLYDAYPFLMSAVLKGEGIALGWRGLVDNLLENGALVRAGPSVSNRETSYYLQHRETNKKTVTLIRLVEWFKSESESPSSEFQLYGPDSN